MSRAASGSWKIRWAIRAASSAVKPLARYEAASSASSSSGIASISARSRAIWRSNSSRWLCIEMYSPAAMLNAPASRPAIPARRMKLGLPGRGAGHAHDQREVADQAVADPEDDRPERPRPAAGPMPRLARADLGRAARPPRDRDAVAARVDRLADRASPALSWSQITACSRSSAAIAATSGDAPWASYASSSSPSSALTRSATAAVPSSRAARMMNRTRIRGPIGGRDVGAEVAQLRRPDVGVPALVAGDPLERRGAARVLLDRTTARRTGRSRRVPASGCRGSARRRSGAPAHRRPSSAA